MIRLINRLSGVVGAGLHRSGWPYALRCLEPLLSEKGVLFDDFVEASFSYSPIRSPHREPWVGVFHHPYDVPDFLHVPGQSLADILKSPMFRASLPYLKLGITLSGPLGAWLQKELDIPFVSLLLPTEAPTILFSETAFLANKKRRIIQVGCYLRNTSAIYQLEAPGEYTKSCLLLEAPWVKEHIDLVVRLWRIYNWGSRWNRKKEDRLNCGTVEISGRVSDDAYDRLLSENVIFVEFFSAAANNLVVECIARNTPLVVNRLPALEEYLGQDYPLFFDCFEEAAGLFAAERIRAGHDYLKTLDKRPFTGDYFRSQLAKALGNRGLAGRMDDQEEKGRA